MALALLAVIGSLSLLPLWLAMGRLWADDALRSIGATFPLVACVGIVAAWRRLAWCLEGTFWALPIVAFSILLARAVSVSGVLVGYGALHLAVINFGTALFLYGVGTVLLFGGPRLLRASIAPLCLLLLIDPLPQVFNSAVDLPLQEFSALVARSFAHLLGLRPTGANLQMMFSPDFGMFIAPGCNGVRGAVTLGFLALILGYVRSLRPVALACLTLAAVGSGYALNLLRLCVLVVYYRIGISNPSLQKYGAAVDYAIGCTLFLCAALGFRLVFGLLHPGSAGHSNVGVSRSIPARRPSRYATALHALCFLSLTSSFVVKELDAARGPAWIRPSERTVLGHFPPRVGNYTLTRTWAEHASNGNLVMALGEYRTVPGSTLTLGLWMGAANHRVADSKRAQGELAQWTGSFDAVGRNALPVHFVTTFYDDGIGRHFDAESLCSESGCTGRLVDNSRGRVFFRAPALSDLASSGRWIPILLRREWPDTELSPSAQLRSNFEADARLFVANLDMAQLLP